MIEKHRQIVYDYWSKTEYGRAMIKSNNVSDSDLLFLIPNNKKKILGLPLTRPYRNRKKNEYKRLRRKMINSFRLFDIIGEVVDDLLGNNFNSEFFEQFVEVQDIAKGDYNL